MAQSAEFIQAKMQAIAAGKAELSFGERLRQARRIAASELNAKQTVAKPPLTKTAEKNTDPVERNNYRGAYKTKRPANRISVEDAIAREARQQKKDKELQELLKQRQELRAKKQEEKKRQEAIAAQRLKEAKQEKRDAKLPEFVVGQPDANGKIPVTVLDHQNTKLLVRPGTDIPALIKKIYARPENEIKPLAYSSPNID